MSPTGALFVVVPALLCSPSTLLDGALALFVAVLALSCSPATLLDDAFDAPPGALHAPRT